MAFNGIDGDYAEFGSHGCNTFALAYQESRRNNQHNAHLWAFDSFQGLPRGKDEKDEHPNWMEGGMETSLTRFLALCASRNIPDSEYTVVPGFYEDTLPALKPGDAPQNIALAYIDCDLYSSTCDVLGFLMPRLKHGMIMAFDDYFCWSATGLSGERKAMLDYFGGSKNDNCPWRLEPYMQYGWHGQSFVVESKEVL